jgi:uncharacterized membrane protein YgcG
MGQHRVDGIFKGLAKLKDPPIKVTIAGSLAKNQRQKFRQELAKLAQKFGLQVTVGPDM